MGFNKKSKVVFLFFLVFTLFFSFQVSAEKVEIEQNNGILISTPNQEYMEVGEDYEFNFHLSRLDDGNTITDNSTTCLFTLYCDEGNYIISKNASYDSILNNWYVEVNGSNLSRVGEYNYFISCEDDLDKIGGVRSKQFFITKTGSEFSESYSKTYNYSLLVMLFFSVLFFMISTIFNDKDNSEVNKKNKGARFFFISLSVVTAVIAMLYIMITMQTVMPEFSALVSGFSTFHYVILSVLFILFIFIMLNITSKLLEDMKAKSGRVPGRFNPYRQGKRMNPGRSFG
ncbi:MAG: hypothetical protein ACOCT9_00175 [archaeon]